MPLVVRNRFYSVIALALALLIAAAFTRTFYARELVDLPPLPALLLVHGFTFTAWMALFVVQTRLVAARRIDLRARPGFTSISCCSACSPSSVPPSRASS